jgi:hypothetical protein
LDSLYPSPAPIHAALTLRQKKRTRASVSRNISGNAVTLSRHSGRDCSPHPWGSSFGPAAGGPKPFPTVLCSPHPWGSSFGPCCARPNLLRANLCRTNRQDSRFARIAPEGCRAGSPGMNPVHKEVIGLCHPWLLDPGIPCRGDVLNAKITRFLPNRRPPDLFSAPERRDYARSRFVADLPIPK